MVKVGEFIIFIVEWVWLECEKLLSDGVFSDFLNVFVSIGGLSVISVEFEK